MESSLNSEQTTASWDRRAAIRGLDRAAELLAPAGVRINGPNSWDIQIHHPRTIERVLAKGLIGLGEAYMDQWWDCDALDEFASRVLRTGLLNRADYRKFFWATLHARLLNLQRKGRAFDIGRSHYDLGNDLFEAMLDSRLTYSCGFWTHATTLEEAQEKKLDLICRKLRLKPGMCVLDIGCGWGAFAKFAAENYGVDVVGSTVSGRQVELGQKRCQGLPVEIRFEDYRDTRGQFDAVVSIGMFEHVGKKNYQTFMNCVRRLLRPDGLFVLHTIGRNTPAHTVDPWIAKYIFPHSLIPSPAQISPAIEGLRVMEDWHNFGADYDKTLMAWWRNFDAKWPQLRVRYGGRFYRMWRYYLLTCAGAFRARTLNLWQIVLSPSGVRGGYWRPI